MSGTIEQALIIDLQSKLNEVRASLGDSESGALDKTVVDGALAQAIGSIAEYGERFFDAWEQRRFYMCIGGDVEVEIVGEQFAALDQTSRGQHLLGAIMKEAAERVEVDAVRTDVGSARIPIIGGLLRLVAPGLSRLHDAAWSRKVTEHLREAGNQACCPRGPLEIFGYLDSLLDKAHAAALDSPLQSRLTELRSDMKAYEEEFFATRP